MVVPDGDSNYRGGYRFSSERIRTGCRALSFSFLICCPMSSPINDKPVNIVGTKYNHIVLAIIPLL
jgi:hypothetical protein